MCPMLDFATTAVGGNYDYKVYIVLLNGVQCTHAKESKAVSHAIEFIETTMFTRQIKQIATDDELRELQKELIGSPHKGDLIQKTGGLRKIRMATGAQGKSGSNRVIYFLATEEVIYLVMAYPKSIKDNLTESEKSELKKLTKLLKDEV
jgi:hypothetical protein